VGERLQIFYDGPGGGWFWGKVLEAEPLKSAVAAPEGQSKYMKKKEAASESKRTRSEDSPAVGESKP
jgi:hypothetical protein